MVRRVKELPENPKKGVEYEKIVEHPKTGNKRAVTFKATGKSGFGKYKITSNKKKKKKK